MRFISFPLIRAQRIRRRPADAVSERSPSVAARRHRRPQKDATEHNSLLGPDGRTFSVGVTLQLLDGASDVIADWGFEYTVN